MERAQVIIIGAGFGGFWAARALDRGSADITVVDRNNYHTFLPLLYQVAAAEQTPEEITFPVRGMLRRVPDARFVMGTVQAIDLDAKLVKTEDLQLSYDYLVIAAGSLSAFFGIAGAEEHAFQLKTLEQSIALRNHILSCFEHASHVPDEGLRRELLTFAIVGGGAMGVEFAGALAELVRGPFKRDYPALDFSEVRLLLVEATDHLLPEFSPKLQKYCVRRLNKMGIEVLLNSPVTRIEPNAVTLKDGTEVCARTVVWTAGVQGSQLTRSAGFATNRRGQVIVQHTLQVESHPEVYVVGDLAYVEGPKGPLPMVAPVAIQEGRAAGRNILRQIRGLEPVPFTYRDHGRMATIGRNSAVVEIAGLSFVGRVAWWLWLFIHLLNLIGFRNRVIVLINWAWDYILMERAIRLILPSESPKKTLGP